ncbi:MAG: helix-turn-helix transcriptional regulator [Cyanobacteria bacterium]|nr:helix-turn-helix transcriptional regulator [Cyanobacteriota bacterium]
MKLETRVLKTLSKKIREQRRLLGWSQMYLAAEVGVEKSYIGKIERCQINPGVVNIARIAEALGVHVVELLDDRKRHL